MAEISKTPVSDFDAAVRLLSGGTNVAIYNDLGLPSIYVRRDKGAISDVIDGGYHSTHYAFRVNGSEVPAFYMGKYLATVYKGRALSLPLQDPTAYQVATAERGSAPNNYVNFDNAKLWCEANGAGFHLPTIAEYAWIALMSRKNGTMPNGNNSNGKDGACQYEKGVGSYFSDGNVCRTLTGSGPAKWNDNWKPDGICDLNGNVNEWQGGYRTVDGELQIFADNDAAMQYAQNKDSTLWRAILQDGTLVEPGSNGSLKWDYIDGTPSSGTSNYWFRLNTTIINTVDNEKAFGSNGLTSLQAANGIIVPDRLKALALMPDGNGGYGGESSFMRNIGERIMVRGGGWNLGSVAGVFCAGCEAQRSQYSASIGFRPAFIPGI